MSDGSTADGTDRRDPGHYRFWTDEHVRFADLDPLGHVNNGAIGVYFEQARVELLNAAGHPLGRDGRSVSVVRLSYDFKAELRWPARLRVGVRVLGVGRTSFSLACAVFDPERCAATNEAVCVMVDLATRRPTPVPDDLRAALLAF